MKVRSLPAFPLLFIVFVSVAAYAQETAPDAFPISADSSTVLLRTYAGGWVALDALNTTQEFYELSGEIRLPGGSVEQLSVSLHIVADSLRVLGDVSDMVRREALSATREVAMETNLFPIVTFTSTRVVPGERAEGRIAVTVEGDLSLHGRTRSERMEGWMSASGDTVRVHGTLAIRHSDYGMRRKSVLGGMAQVRDEIGLEVRLLAIRPVE